MKNLSIVELTHHLIKPLISKDDIVVDATMGNGFDTVFLAQHARHVYAFDIQKQALIQTKEHCEKLGVHNVELILDSHEHVFNYIDDFKLIIFNLGYLPKGDHNVTTCAKATLNILKTCMNRLPKERFMVITAYPGHKEGLEEVKKINAYLKTLDPLTYKVLRLDLPFATQNPPFSYIIKT